MIERLKMVLLSILPKALLLDLYDRATAEAWAAHDMVHHHSRLNPKRAKSLVGQARFRMMEQGFEEVCELHGGHPLDGGLIPGSNFQVFQPFMRFQAPEIDVGVVLGLAAMPETRTIPNKNMSRLAGVTLNYNVTPRLDFDGTGPKPNDIFVLFLFARDPLRAGHIEEVAIGMIDSAYTDFMFYESIEKFLAGYATEPDIGGPPGDGNSPLVTLKRSAKPFIPSETKGDEASEDNG